MNREGAAGGHTGLFEPVSAVQATPMHLERPEPRLTGVEVSGLVSGAVLFVGCVVLLFVALVVA